MKLELNITDGVYRINGSIYKYEKGKLYKLAVFSEEYWVDKTDMLHTLIGQDVKPTTKYIDVRMIERFTEILVQFPNSNKWQPCYFISMPKSSTADENEVVAPELYITLYNEDIYTSLKSDEYGFAPSEDLQIKCTNIKFKFKNEIAESWYDYK